MKKFVLFALVMAMLLSVVLFASCKSDDAIVMTDDDFLNVLQACQEGKADWSDGNVEKALERYHALYGSAFSWEQFVVLLDVDKLEAQTVTGECTYPNAWNPTGTPYGCKVDVTVKNGVIISVKLYSDEESGMVRTSASNEAAGWNHDTTEAKYAAYLKSFEGKKVEDVKSIKVLPEGKEAKDIGTGALSGREVVLFGGEKTWAMEGATQSAARIVTAIQDALSKLAK